MSDKKAKPSSEKEKKPKLVRDSFTMPKNEYAAFDALKERALQLGVSVKKSELLRAGLLALAQLNDTSLKAAMAAVPTLKTGRPAQEATVQAEPKVAPKAALKPSTKTTTAKPASKAAAKAAPAKSPTTPSKPAAPKTVEAATPAAATATPPAA